MAALVERQQYGLSFQDKRNNANKSFVFVKLTDSALRSIEEYSKNRRNIASKPTIQFHGNNGVFSLPKSDAFQETYGFTVSNIEGDGPQGSFECVQQSGPNSLKSLGCMLMKMHIHANEDSYEKTRVKMAAAEQESKKLCTKEIKPSGVCLGRKVKVKVPGLTLPSTRPSSPDSCTPHVRACPPPKPRPIPVVQKPPPRASPPPLPPPPPPPPVPLPPSAPPIPKSSTVLIGNPSEVSHPPSTREYNTIISNEQRAQYKDDFNAQYEEYLQLHSKIKSVSRKFASLEDQLHMYEEGSPDFTKIKSKIYREYRAHQEDPKYIEALKKFNVLHCKLSHIKRLVMEYDRYRCLTQGAQPS